MADFNKYYEPRLLPFEGGYVNDPADKGGETYKGISRVANPDWTGWKTVDAWKKTKGGTLPRNYKIPDAALDAQVKALYKIRYWDKLRADSFKSQALAEIIVDWYVNGGLSLRKIQSFIGVSPDGAIGPKTVEAINKYPHPAKLFEYIKQLRRVHYDNLVKEDPTQLRFYEGWKNRISSFFFR